MMFVHWQYRQPDCVVTRWFRRGLWVKTIRGWLRCEKGDVIFGSGNGSSLVCGRVRVDFTPSGVMTNSEFEAGCLPLFDDRGYVNCHICQ